jgi:hypothetical protein
MNTSTSIHLQDHDRITARQGEPAGGMRHYAVIKIQGGANTPSLDIFVRDPDQLAQIATACDRALVEWPKGE